MPPTLTELEKIRRYCEDQKELYERNFRDSRDEYYAGAAVAMAAAVVFIDLLEKNRVLRRDDDPVDAGIPPNSDLAAMALHHAAEFIKVRDGKDLR